MQPNAFFGSLFDYSFSSFITPRIIRVLYILATIGVALWTLVIVLVAFNASAGLGFLTLVIGGPIFFVLAMIYVRIALEVAIVFFRIHEDVQEINHRSGGSGRPVAPVSGPPNGAPSAADAAADAETPPPGPGPPDSESAVSEAAASEAAAALFCDNCGAERRTGQRFCTSCGAAFA